MWLNESRGFAKENMYVLILQGEGMVRLFFLCSFFLDLFLSLFG